MRNQYKILAEKYSLIVEDDKEDILAGLGELDNTLGLGERFYSAKSFEELYSLVKDNQNKLIHFFNHETDPLASYVHEKNQYLWLTVAWIIIYFKRSLLKSKRPSSESAEKALETSKDAYDRFLATKNQEEVQEDNSSDKEDILAGLGELDLQHNQLPVLIKHISKYRETAYGGEESLKPVEYYFDTWREHLNQEIAFDNGFPDDELPDYDADMDEIYYYMDKAIRETFAKHPEVIQQIAPNLTLQHVEDALDKWSEEQTY